MPSSDTAPFVVRNEDVYDLIGLGYGPAHLALSIALKESSELAESNFKSTFLEKRGHFAWHPSLLLPGSQLQVSPLKDLVTLRDPTSTYSFINYLHSNGRLAHYINKEQHVPSRREWTAYLAWAAKRMEDAVHYAQDVRAVQPLALDSDTDGKLALRPAGKEDRIALFRIVAAGEAVRYARNVSVAVGGVPRLPVVFESAYEATQSLALADQRIIHSANFLPALTAVEPSLSATGRPLRLAVIGGGQSSTEMLIHLHERFPTATVTMILRASALVPSDDTGFVNSAAFDPDRTDEFWRAPLAQRRAWLAEFKRTNYSVVRSDLLAQLHDTLYDTQEVELPPELRDPSENHRGRIEIRRNTTVQAAKLDPARARARAGSGAVVLDLKDLHGTEEVAYDAVWLGTGFNRAPWHLSFLEPLRDFYPALDPTRAAQQQQEAEAQAEAEAEAEAEEEDEEVTERRRERVRGITRDYRLVPSWASTQHQRPSGKATPASDDSSNSSQHTLASSQDNSPDPGLYVLGGNEATHGLSDSLLSIVAHRAGELTTSLLERLPAYRPSSSPPNTRDTVHTVSDKIAKLSTRPADADPFQV